MLAKQLQIPTYVLRTPKWLTSPSELLLDNRANIAAQQQEHASMYIYTLVKFIVPYGTRETISGKMVMENWYVAMH